MNLLCVCVCVCIRPSTHAYSLTVLLGVSCMLHSLENRGTEVGLGATVIDGGHKVISDAGRKTAMARPQM